MAARVERTARRLERGEGPGEARVDPALMEHLLKRSYPTNVRELDTLLWSAMTASPLDRVMLPPGMAESQLSLF